MFQPGELVEWAFVNDTRPMPDWHRVWSSVNQGFVPVGSQLIHMLVSDSGDFVCWLNGEGFFSMKKGDSARGMYGSMGLVEMRRLS